MGASTVLASPRCLFYKVSVFRYLISVGNKTVQLSQYKPTMSQCHTEETSIILIHWKNNNQCGDGKRHILVDFNAMTWETSATAPRLVSPHYISYENWFVILVAVHRIRANTPVCIDCRWDTFVIRLRKKKPPKRITHGKNHLTSPPKKKKKDKTEFLCQESRNFNKNDKGKKRQCWLSFIHLLSHLPDNITVPKRITWFSNHSLILRPCFVLFGDPWLYLSSTSSKSFIASQG